MEEPDNLGTRNIDLGRPLTDFVFSLMALIGDPIYDYFSKGFRGQPSDELSLKPSTQRVLHILLLGCC